MKGGGLIRVRPNGCSCAGDCAAVEGSEGRKTGNFGDRVCVPHVDRTQVPGLPGLFNKPVLDIEPAFLVVC